jgi:repressor LexA
MELRKRDSIMLTPREQDTYSVIQRYFRKHGHPPYLREIAAALGVRSKAGIHRHLQALERKGHISLTGGHRGIELTADRSADTLPLLGRIAAGKPIEAIRDEATIDLAAFVMGRNRYALRVKGDSMIEAGILNGDTVIVEARDQAQDGEMVVALVDNGESTLKRLKRRKDGSIQLTPANAAIAPMIYAADRVRIQGVVVAVLRSYR